MYSLAFPNMFTSSSTNIIKDNTATLSNLRLLLQSDVNGLFGDPYYGTALRRFIHDQNSPIVKDLVIDCIYTSILTFMPLLIINRNNIDIVLDKGVLYANIKVINKINYVSDLYSIELTSSDENS